MDDSPSGPLTPPSASPKRDSGEIGADNSDQPEESPSLVAQLFRRAADAFGIENGDGSQARLAQLDELAASPDQRAMLRNVYSLGDQRIDDVMAPRSDIAAVPVDATLAEVLEVFRETTHTRLPVYRDSLDDPIGFVHLKDVALEFGFANCEPTESFDLSRLSRRALFVPPSMSAGALLRRMQAARVHMALVIDEFGGVDGLVTIEDLVELVVGDIEDEHDAEEETPWTEESPGIYLCAARADIEEFEAAVGVRLTTEDWDEDVDTLGGLVVTLINRVPERGEVISLPQGREVEVIDADPRRIKRLRVLLHRRGGESRKEAAE